MQVKNLAEKFIIKYKQPVKMQWQDGFAKTLKSFDLFDEKLGDLHIDIKSKLDNSSLNEKIFLNIRNSKETEPLVQEIIEIFKNKNIIGHQIEVLEKYRHKNLRLGELMRLLSISLMNENRSNTFRLYSKNTAIGFHTKYKFHTDISDLNIIDAFLKKIASEKTKDFKSIAQKAQEFEDENWTGIADSSEWLDSVNNLITGYLKKITELKRSSETGSIPFFVDMELNRKELLENRSFYNSLFEKHGIDYKI